MIFDFLTAMAFAKYMEKDTFLINYLVLSWYLRPPMDFGERSLYTKILHLCHNYACRECILFSYDGFL